MLPKVVIDAQKAARALKAAEKAAENARAASKLARPEQVARIGSARAAVSEGIETIFSAWENPTARLGREELAGLKASMKELKKLDKMLSGTPRQQEFALQMFQGLVEGDSPAGKSIGLERLKQGVRVDKDSPWWKLGEDGKDLFDRYRQLRARAEASGDEMTAAALEEIEEGVREGSPTATEIQGALDDLERDLMMEELYAQIGSAVTWVGREAVRW